MSNLIPKIIHYWFGHNELPPLAQKCIASWHMYFPDYEIKKWDEDNFDVNQIPYTQQAYRCKKFAFVSDYARFKILYDNGGIYFDTDVEVIRPMDEIIAQAPYMGIETEEYSFGKTNITCSVNPGLGFATPPRHPFFKEMIDLYSSLDFEANRKDYALKTITQYTSEILQKKGWSPEKGAISKTDDITIFPKQYFNPFSNKKGTFEITDSTYSIHHYASSWLTPRQKLINKNKYISLLFWLLHRSPRQNLNGLIRVLKERKIWH